MHACESMQLDESRGLPGADNPGDGWYPWAATVQAAAWHPLEADPETTADARAPE